MPSAFDHQETTLTFEPSAGTVELYTTSRRIFLRAVARNAQYLEAQALEPGYRVVYPVAAVKDPTMVLKPGDPAVADAALQHWLTDSEKEARRAAATRVAAARQKLTAAS